MDNKTTVIDHYRLMNLLFIKYSVDNNNSLDLYRVQSADIIILLQAFY